jgi:hypothetical protein
MEVVNGNPEESFILEIGNSTSPKVKDISNLKIHNIMDK